MDIRKKTVLIVRRGNEYLTGFSLFLRWSISPYDGWHTRDISKAKMVANKVGGELVLFNPVANQIRDYLMEG